MLPPISESLARIYEGAMLIVSGLAGLIIPLAGLLFIVGLGKWFVAEPTKALRLTMGGLVMFGSLFVPSAVSYAIDFPLSEKPLLFLGSVLASVYCGSKLGKWIMGKHGEETS